jgi:hypothetical protein
MGNTLVLGDPLVMRPRRLDDRVLARVFGASLDESLAAGRPPESSPLLAARAQDIVSLRRRRSTARNWENLLRRAREAGSTWPHAALPVCADQIIAAEPAIRDLAGRLAVPLPVPARGVAMARALLTDGSGPVYNPRARTALAAALEAAIAQLDPSLPLLP